MQCDLRSRYMASAPEDVDDVDRSSDNNYVLHVSCKAGIQCTLVE